MCQEAQQTETRKWNKGDRVKVNTGGEVRLLDGHEATVIGKLSEESPEHQLGAQLAGYNVDTGYAIKVDGLGSGPAQAEWLGTA